MIPRSDASLQTLKAEFSLQGWQKQLADAFNQPQALLRHLGIDTSRIAAEVDLNSPFPFRVPRDFVSRMQHGNPHDPLLLQVLPLKAESSLIPGYHVDPVGDLDAMSSPGLLKKYHGRALVITTGACGVHCRYCFRRHFPYQQARAASENWQHMLAQLQADSEIEEIILSGGDPLSLSDVRLSQLIHSLGLVPHIKRIRIHSRMPVVLPDRVTDSLLDTLAQSHKKMIMVIHANHPNEISPNVKTALLNLHTQGTTLLNQSVLLKNINDDSRVLARLSEQLFESNVLPYYLHMLDKVHGAGHFDVDIDRAKALVRELREQLPGYLVPLLVQEQAGQTSKIPLDTNRAKKPDFAKPNVQA